jgi:sugar lactone lactonase YvrE
VRAPDRGPDSGRADLEPCPSPCVTTLAGRCGLSGHEDGPASSAKFFSPCGMAFEASGALLVADRGNNVIRRIAGGQVTTFAGTGSPQRVDGPVANAAFNGPNGLAALASGAIVVADGINGVRQIAGGQVTTLAKADSLLCYANGVVPSSKGLIIVDSCHNRVDVLTGGTVTVLAGTLDGGHTDGPLSVAQFSFPHDAVIDGSGGIYIADSGNDDIRRISDTTVTTAAGSFRGLQDGPALQARFDLPTGVAMAADGSVIVADTGNHRIRRLASGQVSTLAGTVPGYQDGPGIVARFSSPERLAVDSAGTIYVADTSNHCIRVIR